jgi:hypothetical protein
MKSFFLLLLISLSANSIKAQDVTGQWNGMVNIQGMNLRIVFHITKTDSGFTSTMQSPDQGNITIPVSKTSFENGKLSIEIQRISFQYDGELKGDSIVGIFKQSGLQLPMNLTRKEIAKVVKLRPQEPKKPYPYISDEVTFKNEKANVTLAGTLTLPEKGSNFSVAILITGSGPQNRDEELLGHKPFLVISDYLTRNGIAVLRYDDRGVAKSTGDFKAATTADFATDVESAIAYLKTRKEINKKEIGLIGHSEGGVIAPMVAARSKDVAFIVMLAGTGIPGDKLLLLQQELIAKADGASEEELEKSLKINAELYKLVINSKNEKKLEGDLSAVVKKSIDSDDFIKVPAGTTEEAFINATIKPLTTPWMQYFIKYDPAPALSKVKCPVLVLNGSHDLQVPPSANLPAIEKALKKGGNKNVTVMELPGLNHLFQESKTGAPSEYADIEQTFSPLALDAMTKWILKEMGGKK